MVPLPDISQIQPLGEVGQDSTPDLPPDFDPDLCPIIACHWFGIHPHGVTSLWWRFAGLGHRLPAEPGVIILDGGGS